MSQLTNARGFRARKLARLSLATCLALYGANALADAALSPHADDDYVALPPGAYAGEEPGLDLVFDYGTFQLWRVDAAHRSELNAVRPSGLQSQPRSIGFEAGSFEPGRASVVPTAFALGKYQDDYLQVVQLVGPATDVWLQQITAAGLRIVQPVSGNAYIVFGNEEASARVAALVRKGEFLRQSGPLEPLYKLSAELAAKARNGLGDGNIEITVQVVKHNNSHSTKQAIAAMNAQGVALHWDDRRSHESAHLSLRESDLAALAQYPDVLAIEVFHPRQLMDEVQAQIVAGNFNPTRTGPSAPGYLAWLQGQGFSTTPANYPIVDIVDDGLGNGSVAGSAGDQTLGLNGVAATPRIQTIGNCTPDAVGDGLGHGHINTSIVGGYDQRAGFPFVDPLGYLRGQGINPYARMAHTKIFTNAGAYNVSNCGNTDNGVVKSSQDRGAVITSNSWGANTAGNYDDSSQAYDLLTRDGDTIEAGLQPMIHIFAAGNAGAGASTVGSPGTAKNVITVGASENQRPSDEDGAWTDGCNTAPTGADNAMDVIAFSSRGPVEGGRKKPEVIAPGTHIQGTAATSAIYAAAPANGVSVCDKYRPDNAGPNAQTVFAASSGTSHSTPAVAGMTSLVYRWLNTAYGVAAPSAALMKGYLIAHPTYLTGVSANDTLPSNSQGYGMPNLGAAFDATTQRFVLDQTQVFTDTANPAFTWTGSVIDTAKPVRFVLAWSDAAGAIADTTPQVNNLDLTVTVNGSTYLGNVFAGANSTTGGVADAANNYEAVFLPAGTSGAITISVAPSSLGGIAGDGVPGNVDSTDQDFALICTNCDDLPDYTLDATPTTVQSCAAAGASWNVAIASLNGYNSAVTLGTGALPGGAVASFTSNPVTPPVGGSLSSTLNLTTGSVASGNYVISVTGTDGTLNHNDTVTLQHRASAPGAFALATPANGAGNVSTAPTLTWTASSEAVQYIVEVDNDPAFGSIDYTATVTGTSHTVATALNGSTTYHWRVRASNGCGNFPSSSASFTTTVVQCLPFAASGLPLPIGPNAGTVTTSTINVTGFAGSPLDVNIRGLRGTHTWNTDLDVTLQSPAVAQVPLYQDICTDTDNFHVDLDDAAATVVGSVCPPGNPANPASLFRPANTLTAFNGSNPNGTWTLRITDDANVDAGVLQAWSLEICGPLAPSPVVANDDARSVNEDVQLNVVAPGVLGNDVPAAGLTATLVGGSGPSNGTLVSGLGADGSFSYLPASNFCGTDQFDYSASDGLSNDTARVTITVTCVNDAPVAVNDAYNGFEDTPVVVAVAQGVLINDTDVDSATLTAVGASLPANGSVVLNTNGSFTYTPNANYCNAVTPDTFTYSANDGTINSAAPATVSVTFACVNDSAPVAAADTGTVAEGGTLNVAAAGVLTNDTDADGSALRAVLNTTTTNGLLTLNPNGSYSYVHNGSETTSDSFTYHANDGVADSNVVTVAITVTPTNDAPEVNDQGFTVTVGRANGTAVGTIVSTDPDTGDTRTVSVTGGTGQTVFAVSAAGAITVANSTGLVEGNLTLNVTVTDAGGLSDTAVITISVLPLRIFNHGFEGS